MTNLSLAEVQASNYEIFEIYRTEDQIANLESQTSWENFDNKHIVIAVPTYCNETVRFIEGEDQELFLVQKRDAGVLARRIMRNSQARSVRILTNADEADDFVDRLREPVDIVVFVHEFLEFEQAYILESFGEKNAGLSHIVI